MLFFTLAWALFWGAAAVAVQAAPQPAAPVLLARFEHDYSTKSGHSGDVVSAKVVRELKLPGLEIPKGSKIIGTVAASQSKKDGGGTSSLAIHFDRVELKDGQVLAVAGLIVAIGELDNGASLGPFSSMDRGGAGTTAGVDPNAGRDRAAVDEIGEGSSLPGIALGKSLNSSYATLLRGVGRDIDFDNSTEIKVALYRTR